MIDLYLREGQSMVLRAQIEVLDKIRRGVQISILEGTPLDSIFKLEANPGRMPSEPDWVIPERGESSAPSSPLLAAMDKARALDRDSTGRIELRAECCPNVRELPKEFIDPEIQGCDDVDKFLESEKSAADVGVDFFDTPRDGRGRPKWGGAGSQPCPLGLGYVQVLRDPQQRFG